MAEGSTHRHWPSRDIVALCGSTVMLLPAGTDVSSGGHRLHKHTRPHLPMQQWCALSLRMLVADASPMDHTAQQCQQHAQRDFADRVDPLRSSCAERTPRLLMNDIVNGRSQVVTASAVLIDCSKVLAGFQDNKILSHGGLERWLLVQNSQHLADGPHHKAALPKARRGASQVHPRVVIFCPS